jgi:hypothetical protein
MTRYIAKPDTWFDEGTEAWLDTDFRDVDENGNYCGYMSGVFHGIKTFDKEYAKAKSTKVGKQWDSEVCSFDEFEEIEGNSIEPEWSHDDKML